MDVGSEPVVKVNVVYFCDGMVGLQVENLIPSAPRRQPSPSFALFLEIVVIYMKYFRCTPDGNVDVLGGHG